MRNWRTLWLSSSVCGGAGGAVLVESDAGAPEAAQQVLWVALQAREQQWGRQRPQQQVARR